MLKYFCIVWHYNGFCTHNRDRNVLFWYEKMLKRVFFTWKPWKCVGVWGRVGRKRIFLARTRHPQLEPDERIKSPISTRNDEVYTYRPIQVILCCSMPLLQNKQTLQTSASYRFRQKMQQKHLKKNEKYFALTCWISVPKKPEIIWKSCPEPDPDPTNPSQIQLWFGGCTRRPP